MESRGRGDMFFPKEGSLGFASPLSRTPTLSSCKMCAFLRFPFGETPDRAKLEED